MSKSDTPEWDFKFIGGLLRSKHGEPRTSCNGGIKREYFELGDGKIIMLASPFTPQKETSNDTA